MEEILKDLCSVVGVTGAIVCAEDGQPLAVSCSEPIDRSALPGMGKTLVQTLSGLELSRRRKIGDFDLVFDKGRVIVKSLNPGCLLLLCLRQVNVPLINLSANVAVRKLKEQLKQAEPVTLTVEEREVAAPEEPQGPSLPSALPEALPPVAEAAPITDQVRAALSLLEAAREKKAILRVMGEMAIRLRCPTAAKLIPAPEDEIVELACRGRQIAQVEGLLKSHGYLPDERFNALFWSQRLRYAHPETRVFAEVFLDGLISYHQLQFGGRLHLEEQTLTLADLLLSQLQVVFPTERNLHLACAILADHDLGGAGMTDLVDTSLICGLCADDWGWYKTVTTNLEKCVQSAEGFLQGETLATMTRRARRLVQMIEGAPKSLRWQVRARVGESRPWYETPE